MQLLTARRLYQDEMPEGWVPCAAINPESGEYQVTLLDPALGPRFMNLNGASRPAELDPLGPGQRGPSGDCGLGPAPRAFPGRRGGTDLRPVFQSKFLPEHRPDGIIYFTDGCGPCPEQDPGVRTLWILTKPIPFPCTWGEKRNNRVWLAGGQPVPVPVG